MIGLSTLTLFVVAVLMLLLSPGPNMAFVMGHGMSLGWRGGAVAAAGIACADLLLTALTVSGVTALVASWPPAFDIIRYAGVLYLLWLAYGMLHDKAAAPTQTLSVLPLRQVFLRALLNSLLNPKALLFFMVFLPQFVEPSAGPVALQLMQLGGVLALVALLFHLLLGGLSGPLGAWLRRHRPFAVAQSRLLGLLMLGLALRLLLLGRER
ncbi:TPA: LysE family translocator [Pseudomonas aeruginosa]|uniref:LysE family translocator n=1 Tax=Pseudomonas aeruginosa TaxID=287 RepID=UPI00070F9E87|nr:LysE family translocator [Pseudomonas aeruginosa]MBI7022912.1 LysE family translocator [Pseudomonas aeruginosa]MBI9169092.1 LysE family translocator [Pseudomonas aeruginosa]MCO4019909.1 LysE family translocator [Pseudomonas aeruginosa]MCY0312341.1 LysE family translocator [Pseudomonas aeruginosa]MCY0513993.1 LysE family translocator [Pseudomonas aeruginosa]